jgi:hypothetical protein
MSRLSDQEGYLLIDHRESPGITPEEAFAAGSDVQPVGKGIKFESATYNCSHCTSTIIKNPLRNRERGYCPKCNAMICDLCEEHRVKTGICRPFKQIVDEFVDAAAKGKEYVPSIRE